MPSIKKSVLLAAKYQPKKQLDELSGGATKAVAERTALIKRIGPENLKKHPAIQKLLAFLKEAHAKVPELAAG